MEVRIIFFFFENRLYNQVIIILYVNDRYFNSFFYPRIPIPNYSTTYVIQNAISVVGDTLLLEFEKRKSPGR